MNSSDELICLLKRASISYDLDVDLKRKTWIKRGGIASIWIQPNTFCSLAAPVCNARPYPRYAHFCRYHNRLLTRSVLAIYKAGALKKHISKYSIGCFIWSDDEADRYFFDYIRFVQQIHEQAVLEIEIKDGKRK